MYRQPLISSSFSQHDLGRTLFDTVLDFRPLTILEVGALNGYSSHCFLQALKVLHRPSSKLITIDLFEDYDYKKCSMAQYCMNLNHRDGLSLGISHEIYKLDVLANLEFFDSLLDGVGLVFIDISNHCDNLRELITRCQCPVIFEGGSQERDLIDWMLEYRKKPISMLADYGISYRVIDSRFPSLSFYTPDSNAAAYTPSNL